MLQGQMSGLLNFVCQVFLAPLQNSLTFSNQPNGQEQLHIPFPCTWAEAIWQILCARATFSLPVSAFRLFQSPITGEMNFWEQPSFPPWPRAVHPPCPCMSWLLSLHSEPAAVASAWASLVLSSCCVGGQLSVGALGFFLSAHTGEKRTATSMAIIPTSDFVKVLRPTAAWTTLADPCSRREEVDSYV